MTARLAAVASVILGVLGCGHAAGPATLPNPVVVRTPAPGIPGTSQPFAVRIENNSAWWLNVGYGLTAQGPGYVLVPPGGRWTWDVGFLPAGVYVDATTTALPVYAYPGRLLLLGVDYRAGDDVVAVGFPYP